ncbi:ATP-dependent helicase [Sulfodiicoccus acidiphilus]|nr:ATP-dependent helicase [Sulfodiicoccus acidiphilus]
MSVPRVTREDQEILSTLRPYVSSWFSRKYGTFTPPQRAAIPLIKQGRNVLISSPTGTGKTLSAFLAVLDELFALGESGKLEDRVYALYVSPLRALGNDMRRNLLEPLMEIRSAASIPEIRVAVRTGDTPSYQRQKMLRTPPHILITTPESFGIALASPRFRQVISNVKWLIVDEIHELASNKRGAHLSGLIEVYESLVVRRAVVRIGLSATVSPLTEVAKYLGGKDVEIVDARFVKPADIRVVSPVRDLVRADEGEVQSGIYKTMADLIRRHRTTLVFTNTRSATERVAYKLAKALDGVITPEEIGVHHSSLSRDIRLEVEEKLKRGELKAVISSTSLELGIDIGYLDLVVLLGSPKSVSRLLQRIGRAGHHIRRESKGRIIVVDRDDLVECSVLAQLARDRKIDSVHIPMNPLDVLSQVIMLSSLIEPLTADELYNLVRRSYNFSTLSREDFDVVLNYLLGKFGLEERKIYAKLRIDENGKVRPKGLLRMMYYMNSGTIPDQAHVPVFTERRKYVGNLEEEFVELLTPGDIFVLGGRTYEFLGSRGGQGILVRDAEGQRPTVPSWFSEMLPLAFDSALEVGKFRGTIADMIKQGKDEEEVVSYLQSSYKVSSWAARSIYRYILEEYLFTGGLVPKDDLVLIEVYDDEEGRRNLVFHTLYGRRTVDALSRAVASVVTDDLGVDVKLSVTDNGFVITLPEKANYDPKQALMKLDPSSLYEVLSRVIMRTEMLKRRFRHCAERSFMILRNYKGTELRIDRRQMRVQAVLDVIKELDEFPVLKETIREILEDYMDIAKARWVLSGIKEGKIRVEAVGPNSVPSPFAHNMLLKEYGDIVLAEDKRDLLRKLHDKVIDFLRQKGFDVQLKYTSIDEPEASDEAST